MLLAYMFEDTIFPQALYSFVTYLCVFLVMPLFGTWIDNTNRFKVLSITIIIQNVCIVISTCLLFTMVETLGINPGFNLKLGLYFTSLLLTSLTGEIMGQGATLALEKDWVVALSGNNDSFRTIINGRMRRIDLFCKLGAPAIFGVSLQFMGKGPKNKIRIGSMVICAWNVVGFFLEISTIKLLYNKNSVLHTRDDTNKKARESVVSKVINGWKFYIHSPMLYASLSYCYLFMSVLDNGAIVQTYLKHRGVPVAYLGTTAGIAAFFGILGTFVTPYLTNPNGRNMSFILVGGLTLWGFWLCLSPFGIEFFSEKILDDSIVGGGTKDAYLILVCMMIARTPLWAFDMAMTQMMQDRVNPDIRAQVSGVQIAISQLFMSLIAVLGMIFESTSEYYILAFITLGSILTACLTYTFWATCCPAKLWDEKKKFLLDEVQMT